MNRYLALLCLMLFSISLQAEMGTNTLCLANFEFEDGIEVEGYVRLISSAFWMSPNKERQFSGAADFMGFLRDTIHADSDIFKTLTKLSCPQSDSVIQYYSVYSADRIALDFSKIRGITCIDYETVPFESYVQLEEDSTIDALKSAACNCINFDIDMEIQDQGGDSIPTYYLASTSKSRAEIQREVQRIRESYRLRTVKMSYRIKNNTYGIFMAKVAENVKQEGFIFINHY